MAWVVVTSVLLDIHLADPAFALASAECLARQALDGLVVAPITYVELAPAFAGDTAMQEEFLAAVGVDWRVSWTLEDTRAANALWAVHV